MSQFYQELCLIKMTVCITLSWENLERRFSLSGPEKIKMCNKKYLSIGFIFIKSDLVYTLQLVSVLLIKSILFKESGMLIICIPIN